MIGQITVSPVLTRNVLQQDSSLYVGTAADLFANVLFLLCVILILRSRHIEGRIDHLRNGFNFSAQLLLNAVKIEPIFVGDQIDGDTCTVKQKYLLGYVGRTENVTQASKYKTFQDTYK